MATIKDVAREAGVSAGTVSNYLNKRVGVSEETSQRIQAAILKLHYVVQSSGRALRQQHTNHIGLVFPNISEPYFEKLVSTIRGYFSFHSSRYAVEISLTDNSPRKEREVLMDFIGRKMAGLVIYSCAPGQNDVFSFLEECGIPYVMIDRSPKGVDCNLVYLDNYSVFYRITKHYLSCHVHSIALALSSLGNDEDRFALEGCRDAFRDSGLPFPEENVYLGEAAREYGFKTGMTMCQSSREIPQIILTTSYRMAEGIRYACHLNHIDPAEEIRIITTGDIQHDIFYHDNEILKTQCNAYAAGEAVCRLLADNIAEPYMFEKKQICLPHTIPEGMLTVPARAPRPLTGLTAGECFTDPAGSSQEPFSSPRGGKASSGKVLTVLTLEDATAVGGLQSLLVDFYHKTGIQVRFRTVLPPDMFRHIRQCFEDDRRDIDVFMFDVPWLKYMAAMGYLTNLRPYAEKYHLDSEALIPNIMDVFGNYKNSPYALPFMVCTQLLFYRSDLFGDRTIRNQYENTCRLPLIPPGNWHQYNIVARFFTRKYNPASPVEYGHSMSLSYPEELICALMPRLWELKSDLYDPNGRIHADGRAMRKAVKGLLDSVLYADPDVILNRPIDALNNFTRGKTAMVSAYYNYAMDIVNPEKSVITDRFGFAGIPGHPVMAGWCLGISSLSENADEAFQFMKWATGDEISVPHTILGGQSPNMSIYRNYDLASMYPWLTKGYAELQNARERKTPISSAGKIMSEKEVENTIYEALRPLIGQAAEGHTVSLETIEATLDRLQQELAKLPG